MQFFLKVSPKGQVVLPKKLRDSLQVKDMIEIDLHDREGVLRKPEGMARTVAGCFSSYATKAGVTVEEALEKAREVTAREVATKAR
ncbi:MAG TPA: AbrB/MazE/SpoVT family DNA-binding domain-containing protein [Desulfuromonadaceae bacterium]